MTNTTWTWRYVEGSGFGKKEYQCPVCGVWMPQILIDTGIQSCQRCDRLESMRAAWKPKYRNKAI